MILTGFADEAAVDLDGQINATLELGWRNIESRNMGGKNIHDIPDADFEAAAEKLRAAGVRVNCFGSTIANWAKQVTDPFDITVTEIKRAIPRMQKLGSRHIRIMSYAVLKDREPDDQMADERFRRLREIQKMFSDAGIVPLHENCMNYGGMGWTYTLKMIDNVPGLKLIFDTGNPIFTDDRSVPPPYPKQSAWEFYRQVKAHVAYVHIKDGTWNAKDNKADYTFPGEGNGDVKRIVGDLVKSGYDGAFSMEPHMAVVFHEAEKNQSDTDKKQAEAALRYQNYVEYGQRFMKILEACRSAR